MNLIQIFIGAGLTLFGICFGFAIATNTDASAQAKWWDLMTAFGTVGAVIVAVALGIWGHWKDRVGDRIAGRLEAARIYAPLSTQVMLMGGYVSQWFHNVQNDQPNKESYSEIVVRIEEMRNVLSDVNLIQLARWRPEIAEKIASIRATCDLHLTVNKGQADYRSSAVDLDLSHFYDLTKIATEVCKEFRLAELSIAGSSKAVTEWG